MSEFSRSRRTWSWLTGRWTTVLDLPVALLLTCAGVFTVSWDRFVTVQVSTYNVKLPVLLFAVSAFVSVVESATGGRHQSNRMVSTNRAVMLSIGVLLATLGLAVFFSSDIRVSAVQSLTVLLGAVMPLFVVCQTVVRHNALDMALTSFIRGGYFAAGFGIYQLLSPYAGLPQVVEYRATSGGLPRISSFSYEAGYFGYFLILVIGAVFARAMLRAEGVSVWRVSLLIGVLVASNTRATLFTLPVLLLLMLVAWPRRIPKPAVGVLVVLAPAWLMLGVVAAWGLVTTMVNRVLTVFDPTEVTSNAPRLQVLDMATSVAADNWLWGVGPGRFGDALEESLGVSHDLAGNQAIVNNVWLQALVDGGVLYLAAQIVLVLVVATRLFRWREPVGRALIAGWLAVMAVASMITSYYFDMKLWVVLGLALAAQQLMSGPVGPGQVRSALSDSQLS